MPSENARLTDRAPLSELVARLQMIPRSTREYTWTRERAQDAFGVDDEVLDALATAGLSYPAPDSATDLFAFHDLHRLGLTLGTAKVFRWAFIQMRRSLVRYSGTDSTRITISYLPDKDRSLEHARGMAVVGPGRSEVVDLTSGEVAITVDTELRGSWPDAPEVLHAVFDRIASYDLCYLPPEAQGATKIIDEVSLCDCKSAARMIIAAARERGVMARMAWGLIAGMPFASHHGWAEILLEEAWVPVDPLMIATLQRLVGLDAGEWPYHRSFGPILFRLATGDQRPPFLTRGGSQIPASYRVALINPSATSD